MMEAEMLTLTKAWHRVKHLWWVRTEPVGSYGPTELCRKLGGHVRYANCVRCSPIMIARFSGTPRRNYRPMQFDEWMCMQDHGQFPLRRKDRGPLAA